MNSDDDQKGFYVEPKRDCPHIHNSYTPSIHSIAPTGPCTICSDDKENWACLTCSKRFCSRYVKGHMAQHYDQTKHPLCVSYSDFSFWCYECDSYVTDKHKFSALLKGMSASKFGNAGTGGRYTAHATKEQMEEKEDPPEVLDAKIKLLAQMVRESSHMIAFTGAGISTSAGIPDFRGPEGVWTLRALGKKREKKSVSTLNALATPCHMALVKLIQADILKFLISQNTDGMHRKSGVPPSHLSELHGNSNLEYCSKCGKEYLRDYNVGETRVGRHLTGRTCSVEGCEGDLLDTLIGFGESLPLHCVQRGFEEAEQSDLCICLGSSLTVTPAADMPKLVGEKKDGKHNLVIVNLQKTPLDRLATLRIFGKCDYVMEGLMRELNMDIPPFILQRRVIFTHKNDELTIEAVDSDSTPVSLFAGVVATFKSSGRTVEIGQDDAPFVFTRNKKEKEAEADEVEAKLFFMGHYNEPPLTLCYPMKGDEGARKMLLSYNPATGEWQHEEVEVTLEDLLRGRSETQGLTEEEMLQTYPKQALDKRHPEHPVTLTPSVYDGNYRCNSCMKIGQGWVYTCAECQFDLHPGCALWRRGI